MNKEKIPYKIYLNEDEMPKAWYNLRADMKQKPAPLLNPGTLQPMKAEELSGVFCEELIRQELDDNTAFFEIPEEIHNFYKMYRPSPLVRAYCLEEKLQTPARIYYKFEGNNTSGSHKLNSAIAQAYYAKKQGLKGVTTRRSTNSYIFSPRSVTLQPMAMPSRILKFATEFFAFVTTAFCPAMISRSFTAESKIFAFSFASPTPMLMTTLLSFGTSIGFL